MFSQYVKWEHHSPSILPHPHFECLRKVYTLVWRKTSLEKPYDQTGHFSQPWASAILSTGKSHTYRLLNPGRLFSAPGLPFQETPTFTQQGAVPTRWHLTGIWCPPPPHPCLGSQVAWLLPNPSWDSYHFGGLTDLKLNQWAQSTCGIFYPEGSHRDHGIT